MQPLGIDLLKYIFVADNDWQNERKNSYIFFPFPWGAFSDGRTIIINTQCNCIFNDNQHMLVTWMDILKIGMTQIVNKQLNLVFPVQLLSLDTSMTYTYNVVSCVPTFLALRGLLFILLLLQPLAAGCCFQRRPLTQFNQRVWWWR